MRRDQLEHAIRTACQIIGADAVIVVGSQAILGSVDEGLLPPEATMSLEVDILPIAADEPSTVELADRIEGVAGEWSGKTSRPEALAEVVVHCTVATSHGVQSCSRAPHSGCTAGSTSHMRQFRMLPRIDGHIERNLGRVRPWGRASRG